jgi:hypothetical protein
MNTVTAEGTANGLTAVSYAFATVLVAAPGLPNTGFPPVGDSVAWIILAVLGISAITIFLIFRKKPVA